MMNPQQPYQQPYQSSPSPTYHRQGPAHGYPGNGYPGHYPQPGPPQIVARGDRNGLGAAALVLGIIAAIFSVIPLIGIVAWPLGITGLILGFVALARVNRREATNRGVTIAGLITSGAALVICVLWLVGIGIAGTTPSPSRSAIPTVAAVPAAKTDAQAAPVAPAKPSGPATRIGDGTYEVGVDMAAGRYKTTSDGSIGICYWERSKDDSGDFNSIISNDLFRGPGSVTVKNGEFAKLSGGCTWTKQ
jgi:hypothetical protein